MDLARFYHGKKVLITGNTGFKGTWMSMWLESLGAEVKGLSKDIPTQPSAFEAVGGEKRFSTAFVDIRDAERTAQEIRSFRPDFVFHMAAQSLVRPSYADPISTWGTNVMGTVHVMEGVRGADTVQAAAIISSDKCYENLEWDYGYRETDRLGGKDPYSASKAGTELAFRSHFESFFREGRQTVVSFRAGNVIGGGDWAVDRIVPDCVRAQNAGKKASIRSPRSTRPWQHVLEPLGGYLVALARASQDQPRWNGESFNFGPHAENSRSVLELVQGFERNWPGFAYEVAAPADRPLHEAKLLKVSFEKAASWMKWEPTLAFDETVAWTARGYTESSLEKHMAASIAEFQARIEKAGWAKW